ncbi:MAG TPA: DHA2 family efflux MFS transporter permease subunit [Candidatus Dormibacteraeota bacterium]|nr:DHA2 family efflux MFS transporter permease subunit [Candidatus Dormibacteraeota bacterium]
MTQSVTDLRHAEPGAPAPAPQRPAHGRRYVYTATGVIALGSTASILSSTVVNVAVPALQSTFHATITDVQWILVAYLLGLSAVIPISGYVSDRFGTKRVYLVTLIAFTLTSGLCGVAWSLQSEIVFRVIQGLAGGMVMPVGMTIVMRMSAPEERGQLMSILGVPMMLAPALGPTLGGWLIQVFDWRWVFWVNLPAGLLALALGYFFLDPGKMPWVERKIDFLGLFLATPGVTLMIYGLTQASLNGWGSASGLLPIIGGAALVVGFVLWELRQEHPLLDMRVFKDAAFAASAGVGVIFASALFGAVFLIPVFMQEVQGKSTLEAGLLLAPQGVGAALAMVFSGSLTDRFGARPVVFVGILGLVASTILLTAITPETGNWSWITIIGVRGMAMGFAMMPNLAAAYVTLAPGAIARATAVSNTLQRVSSSFGIAILATVVEGRIQAHLPSHQALGLAARAGKGAVQQLLNNAAAKGFDDTFWVSAGLAALALPATMLLRRPLPRNSQPVGEGSLELRHPPLSRQVRIAFVVLLVIAIAFFAWTIGKTLNDY